MLKWGLKGRMNDQNQRRDWDISGDRSGIFLRRKDCFKDTTNAIQERENSEWNKILDNIISKL